MMKKNVIKIFCVMIFAALDFTCLCAEPPDLVGLDMPRLTIKNWISKDQLSPRDLEDRIYVIEFWATWCPSCVKTMPHLNELARKYRPDEVLFITFSQDQYAEKPRSFIEKENIDLYAAMDTGISVKLGVTWIPIAYIVSNEGKVLWQGNPGSEAFNYALEKIVKSAPPAFLGDVYLGPYEDLRFQLSGCSGFLRAYRTLRMETRKDKSENAHVAAEIIKAIDAKISTRIEQIRLIQDDDPDTAVSLYRKLIFRFKGAEPITQARAEYEKLKNDPNDKKEPQTAEEEAEDQVSQKD